MSYSTWITYGYGVRIDDIKTTPKRVLELAKLKPKLYENLREYFKDYNMDDITMEDFDNLEDHPVFMDSPFTYNIDGVAGIIEEVINEELPVVFADNYDGEQYILYCPNYPWNMGEFQKNLTEEKVKDIFNKYVKILTDEPVKVDYYDVENGG